jgi:excisionase family DNA binding protein
MFIVFENDQQRPRQRKAFIGRTRKTQYMRKPPATVRSIDEYDGLPIPDSSTTLSDVMLLPEAAAFLRCHPETLKRMAKAGLVPSFRMGSGWRFARKVLTQWMQEGGGNRPIGGNDRHSQGKDRASGAA